MIIKKLSLASLFCALFLLSLQTVGHTAVQNVSANSTISESGRSDLRIWVSALKYIPEDASRAPQVGGGIIVAGHTGGLNLVLSAFAKDITFSIETIDGVIYEHAVIVTHPFSYLDLSTKQRTRCWMELDVTRGSDGSQTEGFKVYKAADNTLFVETVDPTSSDSSCELPLTAGDILLRF